MTIDVLQKALKGELVIPEFSNGVLDLSKAEYILKASNKEFEAFLKFLATPEIYTKITGVVINVTHDEKSRFLNIVKKCKNITSIKSTSLNYHEWQLSTSEVATAFLLMRSILNNPHLQTLELQHGTTYSSMGENTPRIVKMLAKHFETIIISDLMTEHYSYVAERFIDFIQAFGATKLKHLVLKNITFDLSDKNEDEKLIFMQQFQRQLNNLKNDCTSLETLTVENVQCLGGLRLEDEHYQLQESEPQEAKAQKSLQSIIDSYPKLIAKDLSDCEEKIQEAFKNTNPFNHPTRQQDYETCTRYYGYLNATATDIIEKCKVVEARLSHSLFNNVSATPRKEIEKTLKQLHEQIFGNDSNSLKSLMKEPSQYVAPQELDNEDLSFLFN